MLNFNDLRAGDTLYFKSREAGFFTSRSPSPWSKVQYSSVTIEKANKVHYWVDGEKFRKRENGRTYQRQFILSDNPVLLNNNPTDEEMDIIDNLFCKVISVGSFRLNDFTKIMDLELAASLAERLIQIESEIEKAINDSKQG